MASGHELERTADGGWRCVVCTWEWSSTPVSGCPGLPRYNWWPAVPEHLKTKTQLRGAGLQPGGPPVGCVAGRRDWYWLFDAGQASPRRQPTEAQRAVLARGRQTQEAARAAAEQAEWDALEAEEQAHAAQRDVDRAAAAAWARDILATAGVAILDVETTGLDPADAEVHQIALLATDGHVLLDQLVRPLGEIPAEATQIHGITTDQVAGAHSYADLYPQLVTLLRGRCVVAYNAAFDRSMLAAARRRYGLPRLGVAHWHCAMEQYAAWCGDWSDWHGNYRWQPLPGGDHTAVGDCRAVLRLLNRMANGPGQGE